MYKAGHPGYWTGKKRPSPSLETRKKRSESMKGKNTWAKGKKLTIEQRKERSERLKGENSHFWKGGVTSINQSIRASLEYRLWRTAVFERDNYTCIWCGARNGDGKRNVLNADHIKPFAYYPELRFAIDNGRTLCRPCHLTTETFGNKSKRK